MIGTVLDKYEVIQKVGEGGMATVYLGRHTTLRRDVAIKVLHPHLSSSNRNRKRFAREARAIEHLRHDNILEIFDYSGTECADCYIITEFVEGETLSALMARVGNMPSEIAATIGVELAEALAYAHRAGILHRDLKPDNVMIRRDGTVKLMDFGIARFLDESQVTMTGALVGSPAFMSPEQAREGDLDQRSDLFSLGTLLFHLVSGHLPFAGSNPSLILKNIIEGNRPQVSELTPTVSAAFADVIERCMQVDRSERFDSADQVVDALRASLEEVGFDPLAAGWTLSDYLHDPPGYRARLEERLGAVLVERGKTYLAQGDPLAALRLFNRVLTLDEENAEVLALVQGLHEAEPVPRRAPRAFLLLVGLLALVAALTLMLRTTQAPTLGSVDEPAPPSAAVQEPLPTSEQLAPAPEPEIAPSPPPEPEPEATVRPAPTPAPTPRPRVPANRQFAERLPAIVEEPAMVQIRTTQAFMAEIFEDGRRIGDVRQPGWMKVSPGEHLFVLRGPGVYEYPLAIAVAPGERRKVVVDDLQPRPVEVAFDPSFPGSCEVLVNGDRVGSLTRIGHAAPLSDPRRENIVVLDCGAEGVFQRTFKVEDFPYPVFSRATVAP